jgi:hypothetical protein
MSRKFPRFLSCNALAPLMGVSDKTAKRRIQRLDREHGLLLVKLSDVQDRVDMVRLLEIAPAFFGSAAIVASDVEELREDQEILKQVYSEKLKELQRRVVALENCWHAARKKLGEMS